MKIWLKTTAAAFGVTCLALSGCANTLSPEQLRRADVQRRLGDIKLSKGQYELAIREYRRSLELYPQDPETYFGLAEAYRVKGLFGDAEAQLREALRLDPNHQEARLNLGVVLLQQEKWAEAIVENQKLLDDPTFIGPSRAFVNLGWAHYNLGEFEEAKAAFARALKSDRNNYVARLDLGIVLYEEGDLVEAVQHFNKAAEILETRPREDFGPVEAEVRFRAAQAQIKLGQRARALEQLKIASEQGGKGEWGRKSREFLEVLR